MADFRSDTMTQPTARMREAMAGHVEMSDSVFMACPILVETGVLTGEGRYTRMALRHMKFMLRNLI